jgi:hypothetical protein
MYTAEEDRWAVARGLARLADAAMDTIMDECARRPHADRFVDAVRRLGTEPMARDVAEMVDRWLQGRRIYDRDEMIPGSIRERWTDVWGRLYSADIAVAAQAISDAVGLIDQLCDIVPNSDGVRDLAAVITYTVALIS